MSRSDQQKTRKKMLWKKDGALKLGPKWSNHPHANCAYCDNLFKLHELTIDHVIPRSIGGTSHISNLVLACKPCNNEKADQIEKIQHIPADEAQFWKNPKAIRSVLRGIKQANEGKLEYLGSFAKCAREVFK